MSVPFPNKKEKEFLEKYRKEINEKPAGEVFMLIDTKFNVTYSLKTRIFLAYCLFSKEKVRVDYDHRSFCSFIFNGMTVYSFIKNSKEDIGEDVLYGLIEKLELPEDLALKIYNNVLEWEG